MLILSAGVSQGGLSQWILLLQAGRGRFTIGAFAQTRKSKLR